MIKNTGQKKISETMVTKPDITKRQEQLLEELNKCEDELSGQELHRQLIESGKAMGLTTVYRNLQVLIKHGLIRSRHLPTGEVLYTPVDRDIHHLTCVQCGETSKMERVPCKRYSYTQNKSKEISIVVSYPGVFRTLPELLSSTKLKLNIFLITTIIILNRADIYIL